MANALTHIGGRDYTPSIDIALNTYVDVVDANNSYIGESVCGTATSAASWRISKKVVAGGLTTVKYAYTTAGDIPAFDQIWDNRATLNY